MTFYQKLETLCKNRGITITTLANELGFSSSAGTTWKKLKSKPRNSTLKKIADYFGIVIDELEADIDWPIDYESVNTYEFNQPVWQHLLERYNYDTHAAIDAYFAFENAQKQDAVSENSFNTVHGNNNIIGNSNSVSKSLTQQEEALLTLFSKMDEVQKAMLIAHAVTILER